MFLVFLETDRFRSWTQKQDKPFAHDKTRMSKMINRYIKEEFIHITRSPINSLLIINENMSATGDDQGVIKVKMKNISLL